LSFLLRAKKGFFGNSEARQEFAMTTTTLSKADRIRLSSAASE